MTRQFERKATNYSKVIKEWLTIPKIKEMKKKTSTSVSKTVIKFIMLLY